MSADYTAWPFLEAQKLLEKYKQGCPSKGYILFMTGYGPSGLPHIGTLAEVIRTNMVRRAFELLQQDEYTKWSNANINHFQEYKEVSVSSVLLEIPFT